MNPSGARAPRPIAALLSALACVLPAPCLADATAAGVRDVLLSAPAWRVEWSPPDERHAYVAFVHFSDHGGALIAASSHPDGSRCFADIQVAVHAWGFLFHGCTGVPKEMRYDAADADAPFKGRAFGFAYRWSPVRAPRAGD